MQGRAAKLVKKGTLIRPESLFMSDAPQNSGLSQTLYDINKGDKTMGRNGEGHEYRHDSSQAWLGYEGRNCHSILDWI